MILRPRGDDETVQETKKGGTIQLLLFSGQPDKLTELTTNDRVFAGGLVQAGYSAPVDGYGAVLSLDGAGNASVYVPAVGKSMVMLPAGDRRSFPASNELDDVLGTEQIAVIWCENAQPLPPLVAELERTQQLARREGCAIRMVTVTKALR